MRQTAVAYEQERRFTADASHELRTPLTAIKAYTSLLLDLAEIGRWAAQAVGKSDDPASASAPPRAPSFRSRAPGRGSRPNTCRTSSSAFTASRSRGKGGTDLGLAICREIVSSWAGTISVESAIGQGTTAHVAPPRAL